MEFKKQWDAFLKEHKSMKAANEYAYKLWQTKYVSAKKGQEPQEKFTEKVMIPGKIYACFYANMDDIKSGNSQFVDHWPIFFSFGAHVRDGKVYEAGIDLNLIPHKIRVQVLDILYKFNKATIEKNAKLINEGKKGKAAIKLDFDLAKKMLDGTGWERAYIVMRRDKIGKIKVVDYQDWAAMVALNTKGVRGKGLAAIWTDYIKNMGKQMSEKRGFFANILKR